MQFRRAASSNESLSVIVVTLKTFRQHLQQGRIPGFPGRRSKGDVTQIAGRRLDLSIGRGTFRHFAAE